ncbi:phosphomethylpyrimidine kinase [Candidatus Kaiserbacteria bacterium]|nr:MAG: phosphomethylpyrimidine kinase [Candidatus Kaiserbacteria bacterium]
MVLTKTDFKEYLLCNKCLWLKKKRPEEYEAGEFSLFLKKLIKDGYEVESYAQRLFPNGISASTVEKTKEFLKEENPIFQATFETERGLFVKVDILNFNKQTRRWDIYEVKASSSIKNDIHHNHIKDVTFQTVTVEESGVEVGDSYIVYINSEYRLEGEIDVEELLILGNVTKEVNEQKELVKDEINEALKLLSKDDISLEGCDCLYKSHGQRCDCFFKFNPRVLEYGVHNIVAGKKLKTLLGDGILDIAKIPDDFKLTDIQKTKVDLQKSGVSLIDKDAVEQTLSELVFPLYFFDYETYGSAIPLLDGYKANQQVVFQVSIHKLEANGDLEHFEYLAKDLDNATSGLVDMLKENIGPVGSILVWFESFEKDRNKELAVLHPESALFFEDLNERTFDLMTVFKKDYLHPDFQGSASIKKVLPVLLPELSYKNLEVQNGTMAMSEWEKTIKEEMTAEAIATTRENLLEYCKLDTFAMVEIYRKLKT